MMCPACGQARIAHTFGVVGEFRCPDGLGSE